MLMSNPPLFIDQFRRLKDDCHLFFNHKYIPAIRIAEKRGETCAMELIP